MQRFPQRKLASVSLDGLLGEILGLWLLDSPLAERFLHFPGQEKKKEKKTECGETSTEF